MSKVYVVTSGEYSDYHIETIFSDKQKAELYAALNDCNDVEEYEVDCVEVETNEELVDYAIVYYSPFTRNPLNGVVLKKGLKNKIVFTDFLHLESNVFIVNTDSVEKAKKIFYDAYVKAYHEYLVSIGEI